MVVGSLAFVAQGGAQTPPAPPSEEPQHGFYLGVRAGEAFPGDEQRRTMAQSFGAAPSVREGLRLRVLRGEEAVIDATVPYQTRFGDSGWAQVDSPAELQTGDRVEYYVPPTAEVAEQVVIWDGRPTLESCALGSTTAGGAANPRTERLYLAVRPAAGGSDESWSTATQGETWTGTSPSRPLAPGDLLMMNAIYQHDPTFSVTRSENRRAGECRPPEAPGEGLVVFDGHDGLLEDLEGSDVAQEGATVEVQVGCEAESAIACTGPVKIDTVSRYATASAKRKKIRLASRKVSVAPGATRVVRLKVRKAGRRLIDRKRRVAARVTAASKDPSGATRATDRRLTLKAKKRRR
jgi:hypothetical protein